MPRIRHPGQHPRRATVIGAGSFGTAVAVLLERAGLRATLLCRTAEQTERLSADRENVRYLPGVDLPRDLKVRTFGARDDQFSRPDLVFLAVPSKRLAEAVEELDGSAWTSGPGSSPSRRDCYRPTGAPRSTCSSARSGHHAWRVSVVRRMRAR